MNIRRLALYLWGCMLVAAFNNGCSINGMTTGAGGEPAQSLPSIQGQAVYFLPAPELSPVGIEGIAEDILIVSTSQQLENAFNVEVVPRILYLDPGALDQVDKAWLQEIYRNGVMIAAINTPVRDLGAKLEVYTEMADLEMERLPEGYIAFSAHQLMDDSGQGRGLRHWMLTEFFESFDIASEALNMLVELNVAQTH